MKRSVMVSVLCASLGLVALPIPTFAEEGRTLGGYRFVPVSTVAEPFIVTRFGNYTGVAFASDVEFPLLIIDTEPPDTLLSLDGNYLFVVANFKFQWALHPRVALGLSAGGASRVGTSAEALLSQGVTALTAFALDGKFELWRNDRVLLSAFAEAGFSDALAISFTKFVEDILAGNIQSASLVNVEDGFRANGGLGMAWALNEWTGITGLGGIGYSGVEWLEDELLWRITAAWTADFGQRGNDPVGVSLSLDVDKMEPASLDAGTIFGVGGGVYYTGRDDLNLGLEIRWRRIPMVGWDSVAYPVSFGIALGYYF